MISVVVRTKNEALWVGRCLAGIRTQNLADVEIVVVDNESTDHTLDIVSRFDVRLVEISDDDFSFGRSLNWGISESCGEHIALISGHCVPVDDRWLSSLRAGFEDELVAGVYGRQEPLPDTNDLDKRDLWTTFGIERRVQTRDFMFHNANCMISRAAWEKVPFDEDINGVEDRDWAWKMLELGYKLVYEPIGSVCHYHGIHQSGDNDRAARVVEVIELINRGRSDEG